MSKPISGRQYKFHIAGLLACAFLFVIVNPVNVQAKDDVEKLREYTGKISNTFLQQKRPKNGVISNQKDWESLWKTWRPNRALEPVDFATQMVIVETTNGPNTLLPGGLFLSSRGDLKFELSKSRKTGDGFGYLLMVVTKKGIVSVNGRRILATQPAAVPSAQPKPAANPIKPAAPPVTQPAPLNTGIAPNSNSPSAPLAEPDPVITNPGSIKVEIEGRVRTGVSIGGGKTEETGAVVSANGIVIELDFRNDPNLLSVAQSSGSKMAIVKGSLDRLFRKTSIRWIVVVDSIALADGSNQTSPSNQLPNRQLANNGSSNAAPVNQQPRSAITPPPSNAPNLVARPETSAAKNFKSISIKMTRGKPGDEQIQRVDTDGTVRIEVPSTRFSDSFNLNPDNLALLHQFVGQTDWAKVPRSSWAADAERDTIRFEITVEQRGRTMRFVVDSGSVRQSVFGQMFGYMARSN